MAASIEVVLASHNPGKVAEFQALFRNSPVIIRPWAGHGEIVPETGETYHDNAWLKARAVAVDTGHLALADDSGVEVDALGGLPGVHSARFVSDHPWENTREILTRLMSVPLSERTARMRAVLCLAAPDGKRWFSEGVVKGVILPWPRGQNGFGVDPVFSVDGRRSLAEWEPEAKNQVSHRARAVAALLKVLEDHPDALSCY